MKHLTTISRVPSQALDIDAPTSAILQFLVAVLQALVTVFQAKEADDSL